jgi:2-oxoglutarate dehydrogenase E1 component
VERGTFTHRHSILNDFENGEKYSPINAASKNSARYEVYNSHLSETGVMGFEYGYSLADPMSLVIWEAQFGDFANGAQVIIDQFLASGESKWQRMCGLTLLLPHGFEGQGPEHSSARLERFLALCGKYNMSVCNLSTPAQIFHALRRQVKRDFRKPLVVMSPKSLLRNPLAVSTLDDFTKVNFQEVIDDTTVSAASVKKVLLCSGKVYYDLFHQRETSGRKDVAIIRIEQLYPWPKQRLAEILAKYPKATCTWVQEEPRNMGAWSYVFNIWMGGFDTFTTSVGSRVISYTGRDTGAAPAVGSLKVHEKEQKALLEKAFAD